MEPVLFEQDLGMFCFFYDGMLILQNSEMYISCCWNKGAILCFFTTLKQQQFLKCA